MSEKISRRVFLKATGLAALSVAAAGALGGCSISPLPSDETLPPVNEEDYRLVGSGNNNCYIAFTSLSDQWESMSNWESDSKSHRYIYTGLYIKGANNSFTLNKASIHCTIGGKKATVAGLGNIKLNDGATRYVIPSELKVSAGSPAQAPLYIDLGDYTLTSLVSTPIDITINILGETVSVHYTTPSADPSPV